MALASSAAEFGAAKTPSIDFDRDIRPIFSENCFTCHGPDEKARKAKLRFDLHDEALKPAKSGERAIVPGDPGASELIKRINSTDEDEVMPQIKSGKKLTQTQKDLLKNWIAQGAPWAKHWSFEPPRSPVAPEIKNPAWSKNIIDFFVLSRLEREHLTPSPETDKTTLIRRVTLDLTGLPPTIAEVDNFLSDKSSGAYERVVDRLLSSPRYGEHAAHYWLDAVRYADSHGFHIDSERGLWKYRDWVINALNRNMPFDEFTTDQLAGDLLPKATTDQKIASGYLRCNMTTGEGGAIDEEYKCKYTFDRVETTSTIWMGLTMTCCRCHDHKYDPIKQKEYYGLYSLFHRLDEAIMDGNRPNPDPFLSLPTPEQTARLDSLKKEIKEEQTKIDGPMAELDAAQREWAGKWHDHLATGWEIVAPASVTSTNGTTFSVGDGNSITLTGSYTNEERIIVTAKLEPGPLAAIRLKLVPSEMLADQNSSNGAPGRIDLASFTAEIATTQGEDKNNESRKLKFIRAFADSYTDEIAKTISADEKGAWQFAPVAADKSPTALFVLNESFNVQTNAILSLKLHYRSAQPGRTTATFHLETARNEELVRWLTPPPSPPWRMVGPFKVEDLAVSLAQAYPPETVIDFEKKYPGVRGDIKWEKKPEFADGGMHLIVDGLQGAHGAHYFHRVLVEPRPRALEATLRIDDVGKLWLNGQLVYEQTKKREQQDGPVNLALNLREGTNTILVKEVTFQGDSFFSLEEFRHETDQLPRDVAAILSLGKSPTGGDKDRLKNFYRRKASKEFCESVARVAQLRRDQKAVERSIPTTMIAKDTEKPGDTFILIRGEYDKKGEKVGPSVPAILPPWPKDQATNRLGFAKWLLAPSNPLTARVTVNRFWQQFFGVGLVKTAEDFGVQGERPSHPELLDWLATEFMRSGWDVKRLQRLIVTSATYRQSSKETPALLAKDPENRLLARGPRFRVDAEVVRDTALFASGLLVEKLGGHSVKPWQPSGLWEAVSYNNSQKYVADTDERQYERSLYTYWKRQSPPPNMLLFDASTRESCVVRRPRTNTPLQALVLLNDPQFVEASRAMAYRIMTETPESPKKRIIYAFRLATGRVPQPAEVKVLLNLYRAQLTAFSKDRASAKSFLSVGAFKKGAQLDDRQLAAWATVAAVILNLDETLTKG